MKFSERIVLGTANSPLRFFGGGGVVVT